jgi:hypothetical protein
MNAQYIQQASLNSAPGQINGGNRVLFTNLSSQQQTPGNLNAWFADQNHSMQPMPFVQEEIVQEDPQRFGEWFEVNPTNLSTANKTETMGLYFDMNVRTKKIDFPTPSQRIWAVPISQFEMRETDMF